MEPTIFLVAEDNSGKIKDKILALTYYNTQELKINQLQAENQEQKGNAYYSHYQVSNVRKRRVGDEMV